MRSSRDLFPEADTDYFSVGDYYPILESFGEVLLLVDDENYQGDSRVLYLRGDKIGILFFGWGSCSGCDSLQACNNHEEVDSLMQSLYESIEWRSPKDTLYYLDNHDWAGDWTHNDEETRKFISKAREIVSGMVKN